MQAKILTSPPGGSITNQIELWSGSRHSQHSYVKDYFLRTSVNCTIFKAWKTMPHRVSMWGQPSVNSHFNFFWFITQSYFPSNLTISLNEKDRQENKIVNPRPKKNWLGISLKSYFDWSILASTKAHRGQQYLFSRFLRI